MHTLPFIRQNTHFIDDDCNIFLYQKAKNLPHLSIKLASFYRPKLTTTTL